MSSIAELVELLKEGSISKEQMLEKIYSSSFPSKSENQLVSYEKKALAPKKQNFDYDTDIDFNTLEFDDFHPRPPLHLNHLFLHILQTSLLKDSPNETSKKK